MAIFGDLFMVALCNRADHYIFALWFLLSIFFSSPNLSQKSRQKSPSEHHRTTLSGYIFATKARIDTIGKKLVMQQYVLQMSHNMVNFGPLVAEIDPVVWGTAANFNWFLVLAALLHGTRVLVVSYTLRC